MYEFRFRRDVFPFPGREIVHDPNPSTVVEKPFRKVRADKPRPSCYQDLFHIPKRLLAFEVVCSATDPIVHP